MSNQERLIQVLRAPHISEKANRVAERYNQVVFKVLRDATKPEIKDAVELMFKVRVNAVTVVSVKGKRKRFGAVFGKRPDWKKAYVSLEPGHEIDFVSPE